MSDTEDPRQPVIEVHGLKNAFGEQVIHDEDTLAGLNCVAMNLKRVRPVFQLIFDTERLRGQLAQFSHRHEPSVQPIGQWRGKDKPTRLHAYDLVYGHV